MAKVVRPWQGTLLGVLAYIGLVLMILVALAIVAGQGFMTSIISGFMQGADAPAESMGLMMGMLSGMGIVLVVIIIPFAILQYFVAKGLMDGKRWTLIFIIVFSVLGLLSALFDVDLTGIIINGVFVALPATVLKHPFYNKKA